MSALSILMFTSSLVGRRCLLSPENLPVHYSQHVTFRPSPSKVPQEGFWIKFKQQQSLVPFPHKWPTVFGSLKKSLKTHTPFPLTLKKHVPKTPFCPGSVGFLSEPLKFLLPVSLTCGPSSMLCAATLLSRFYLLSQLENKHLEQSHSVLLYLFFSAVSSNRLWVHQMQRRERATFLWGKRGGIQDPKVNIPENNCERKKGRKPCVQSWVFRAVGNSYLYSLRQFCKWPQGGRPDQQ